MIDILLVVLLILFILCLVVFWFAFFERHVSSFDVSEDDSLSSDDFYFLTVFVVFVAFLKKVFGSD